MNRRRFVQVIGAATAAGSAHAAPQTIVGIAAGAGHSPQPPVLWAMKQLENSLRSKGVSVRRYESGQPSTESALLIKVEQLPDGIPESHQIEVRRNPSVVTVSGADTRGTSYALLELVDRVRHSSDPIAALKAASAQEQPATRVRSIARLFASEVHDKPWYNDREMWPQYLHMLATHRFNRFNLCLGMGYDFLQNVTDAYFVFSYPFLLAVPGYDVHVPQLPDKERDSNLAMLKFISEQTIARGLQFQLGLWMHGYKWLNSPNPNYTIEGVTLENHGRYCRDAVRLLLKECPAIGGVTFRIHGESGVEEGSFDFWKTVFEGVATCGRRVEIDMHSKGMNQEMLDIAVATGMPLKISTKYWAEHMGMPYHQADIREQERPKKDYEGSGLMKFSAGSRSFTRYGYGDLLREDRKWGVLTRVWPGTQRLLLWGDPLTAAAHARAFSFSGSDGVEICEPLSFKGRRGSGVAGDRCGYADASLRTRWDWQKYEYTYRVWGRLLYNPEANPDQWQRSLRTSFGSAASSAELALAIASRILPIVTTAYCPSAANNAYWPEMYTNQSIVSVMKGEPYSDTPSPKVFGNASPLDPQLFLSVNESADRLWSGDRDARYTSIEVAQWIDEYAATALAHLKESTAKVRDKTRPEFRRLAIDVALQAGLGRFFAAKLRAGVLYRIHERTGDRFALEQALRQYRQARAAWAELAARAKGTYASDITVGGQPFLRGHWLDRLPAIDADIENMAKRLDGSKAIEPEVRVREILEVAPRLVRGGLRHTPPAKFMRGQALEIEALGGTEAVRLFYRHVNQAERWVSVQMDSRDGRYRASIPAEYTRSMFALQYYFEVRREGRLPQIHPGFTQELNNQPYFLVRSP